MQQVIGSPPGSRLADPLDPLAAGSGASGWSKSAASWPAIFAGAFVAIAASIVLLAFGSGIGFAMVSPWPGHGASATGFTVNAAIWLIVSQWLSAALGGYIAGRLRTKWVGTHTHEVFFRDTAHGLVTWSVATVIVAALLAGSVTSGVGGALHALGGAASAGLQGAAGAAAAGPPGMPGGGPSAAMTYDIDKLFRPGPGGAAPAPAGAAAGSASNSAGSPAPGMDMSSDPRVEAVYIAFHAAANPKQGVSDDDRAYLAQLVQAQTGVTAAEAQKRVDDFVTATINAENKARAAVDTARKAAAEASIFTALALLVGAFIASVSAALGGRLRDGIHKSHRARVRASDWPRVYAELDARGCARLPQLLTARECAAMSRLYTAEIFRSRVVMARHGSGRGEYRYFDYPLPALVRELRDSFYPPLAQLANRWYERLGHEVRFPPRHAAFIELCHRAGQTRPTPLLLQYGADDYNCLHQDLYGEHVFPLQLTVLLSDPGKDFEGGEFVLTEQRPRMQSRVEVVTLDRGDAVVFAVNERPVAGARGEYRVKLRHGVSRIRTGRRHALGIIFHDAA